MPRLHHIMNAQEREPAEQHDRNQQGPEPRGMCRRNTDAQRGCCDAQSQDDEAGGERKSERLHGDLVGRLAAARRILLHLQRKNALYLLISPAFRPGRILERAPAGDDR
jgi:hypothetical protein